MIHVTRINHMPLVLNSDLIEHIESSPDTIISLTNGQKMVVLETVDDIVRQVVEFRRSIYSGLSVAAVPRVVSAECNALEIEFPKNGSQENRTPENKTHG